MSFPPFSPRPLALTLILGFSGSLNAQPLFGHKEAVCHAPVSLPADDPATLAPRPKTSGQAPLPEGHTRLSANDASGVSNQEATATGDVILEHDASVLNADTIHYDEASGDATARDAFTLQDGKTLLSGQNLRYNLNSGQGLATNSTFETTTATAHGNRRLQGTGATVQIHGKDRYRLTQARFNTCRAGDDSWYIEADQIDADNARNVGVARHAKLVFKGVPVLYTPWMDFPLNGARKSGFLAPTASISNSGLELETPYYFNLAPNYDATFVPHFISNRGVLLGGEFRYLQPRYHGQINANWMPADHKDARNNRYEFHLKHNQDFNDKWSGGIDFNQVSDNRWFTDFGDQISVATNNQLNRQAWLNYTTPLAGAPWSSTLNVQKYQTIQPPDSNYLVEKPYALLPQLSSQWQKRYGKAVFDVLGEATRFVGQDASQRNGSRFLLYPSVKWDFNNRWGYVRPKIGLHATQYQLDAFNGQGASNPTRVLPVFNVDAGMTFEREFSARGGRFVQTLEPRFFYNYIPTRAQNDLPNFDSSDNTLNFNQLFEENRFSGQDRINAANSVTLAMTSRILNQSNGRERLRFGVGEKFNFNRDAVALNGTLSQTPKHSDIIGFVSGEVTPRLSLGGLWEYNFTSNTTQGFIVDANYHPAPGSVVNMRYRYAKNQEIYPGVFGTMNQVDLGVQWPLSRNFFMVARQNYSFDAHKPLQQLAGIQYQSDCRCWGVSVLAQRYLTSVNQYHNGVMLQLELRDLTSLGNGLNRTLKEAIPGYTNMNEVQ